MRPLRLHGSHLTSQLVQAFARLLGLLYVAAFTSLYVQLPGLYGSKGGLEPVAAFLQRVSSQLPKNGQAGYDALSWVLLRACCCFLPPACMLIFVFHG